MKEIIINLGTIDWDMLRKQKSLLLEMTENHNKPGDKYYEVTGVLHLIDRIQDNAIKSGQVTEEEAFRKSPNELEVLTEWERLTGLLDLKTLLDHLDTYTTDEEKLQFIRQWHADDEDDSIWKHKEETDRTLKSKEAGVIS